MASTVPKATFRIPVFPGRRGGDRHAGEGCSGAKLHLGDVCPKVDVDSVGVDPSSSVLESGVRHRSQDVPKMGGDGQVFQVDAAAVRLEGDGSHQCESIPGLTSKDSPLDATDCFVPKVNVVYSGSGRRLGQAQDPGCLVSNRRYRGRPDHHPPLATTRVG
ncbi:hypothetical protein AGDE_16530 [Angomonas deanei]|uniref:Uncharacterized protein n=1 Tax=Angomonas deanei TaxID=59799 RepID=A0A7G2C7F1_9TRYP|nr:hypothetical protein AGDE_16530 [Angomonas deanei]CAD2214737.1 hypothetical protein, conserved [Angomonas deanei]|eukprot:EPY16937.1 hypothetical protein AGDE_16530 [Angomonas deanei]